MSPVFDGRLALIAPASAIAEDVLEATLAQLDVLGIRYHLGGTCAPAIATWPVSSSL
jgi:muramoyltetrapeptide carboxypeptidase